MRQLLYISLLIVIITESSAQRIATKDMSAQEYERLIKYYRYYKQDSAIYFAEKGLASARLQGDSNGVAMMLVQLGLIDDNLGEFDRSIDRYTQASGLFRKVNSKTGLAAVTIRIGVVELRNGKYDRAIKYFLDALRIAEESGNRFGIMEANYSISWSYLDQKNYDSALRYLKIAEQLNNDLPFSNISLNIFNHFGVIYRETRQYAKAKQYLERGISLSDPPEYQGLNITLINNLAAVYSKEGNSKKAIALQKDALMRSRQLGNYLRELQALYGLARTYGKEQPREAISYLRQAILLARSRGAFNQEIRYLKAITPLYIQTQNFRDAFYTKEREKTLADSFVNKTISQNIASLKTEYELSKSNARIKELALLNNKKQLELKNATILRNVTFGGIALLLVILGLLYNRYKLKQKKNEEINRKNLSLQHLVEEKEWLLKEVHHRVKNNLHTIMSLLESQSAYLENDALLAVRNSQHRVYAMSLIHQKLYQVDNTSNIDMAVYLPELINYLRDSFGASERIFFAMDIDHIRLDIAQAIPAGLILNEAITNSIKYAFPGMRKGEIQIRMKRKDKKSIVLSIADNGIGLPDDFGHQQKDSLGFRLMKGLTEEIHGHFRIESTDGTVISIEFPVQQYFTHAFRNDPQETVGLS